MGTEFLDEVHLHRLLNFLEVVSVGVADDAEEVEVQALGSVSMVRGHGKKSL